MWFELCTGVAGSEDTFQSWLPTYITGTREAYVSNEPVCGKQGRKSGRDNGARSGGDLVSTLAFYLQNRAHRRALAARLQAEVLRYHTYEVRAREMANLLNSVTNNSLMQLYPERCVRSSTQRDDFQAYLDSHLKQQFQVKRNAGIIKRYAQKITPAVVPAICIGIRIHQGARCKCRSGCDALCLRHLVLYM